MRILIDAEVDETLVSPEFIADHVLELEGVASVALDYGKVVPA